MAKRLLDLGLALWVALALSAPAWGANTVPWLSTKTLAPLEEGGLGTGPNQSRCAVVRFTAATAANESTFLEGGGRWITFQSDGDAAGAGTGEGDLYACNSSDGNLDGTPDTLSCAGLGLRDDNGDGYLENNTLDGGATPGGRGTLVPITIAGKFYVDPDAATITGAEVFEVVACVAQ